MIEAVVQGGWKSISIAIVLLAMSVLSLSSMFAEIVRIRREMKNLSAGNKDATAVWAHIQEGHARALQAGYRGKHLYNHMEAIARMATMPGTGHATMLASVGSNAPYVGLFGTVVGIYGALHALGSGMAVSADQIAGPVGEALVMTALGLVVAIPAVLGFNYIAGQRARLASMASSYAIKLASGIDSGPHIRDLNTRQGNKRGKFL